MSDPLEPIQKIGEALGKMAKDLGLDLQQFVIVPDITGGTAHVAQAVFILDGADVMLAAMRDEAAAAASPDNSDQTPPSDPDLGREFEEIMLGAARADEDDKTDKAKEAILGMKERLAGGGSILGDDAT